ncbi:D-aminoacyl-tRNA deacylase [Flavobacteriaceae bacterium]|nr:D-aminoacyl-tRNA deacylase [Flavobacteriaceae bacterium]
MKVVVQRVSEASVVSDGVLTADIGIGLLVLVGVTHDDTKEDVDWLVNKIINQRIFNDDHGVMNRSLLDVDGGLIVVSQFTLQASTKKGHRPSYMNAAKHDLAVPLYEYFKDLSSKNLEKNVGSGIFGTDMKVSLVNDGPVTLVMDSKNRI